MATIVMYQCGKCGRAYSAQRFKCSDCGYTAFNEILVWAREPLRSTSDNIRGMLEVEARNKLASWNRKVRGE